MNKHDRFFATILLTENAFIILASSVGTAMAIDLFGGEAWTIVLATVLMTIAIVTLGEITPKSLAAQGAERWSLLVVRIIEIVMVLETALIFLFTLPLRLLRAVGVKVELQTPSVTEGELRMLIDIARTEGEVERQEAEMMHDVLEFGDRPVREVMVPRTDIVWVEAGTRLAEFLPIYTKSSHSRFPVYQEEIDNVVRVLYIKDLFKAMAQGLVREDSVITDFVRPGVFIPESKKIGELFQEMRTNRFNLAMIVDEFGGNAGLVTVKQLLEEVVGPVGDEDVEEEQALRRIDERTVQVDAGMRLDEFNDELGVQLPKGQYETLAGFLLTSLGHIPREGEAVRYNDFRYVVTKMQGVKIDKVLVTKE